MAIAPSANGAVIFQGWLDFSAQPTHGQEITDSYEIRIEFLSNQRPKAWEIGGRISRDPGGHIFADGSLCLGSPLKLELILSECSIPQTFVERCLVPYLYAESSKAIHGGKMPFGELAHGTEGIVDDYCSILGAQTIDQAKSALTALSLRRRVANKKPCPCACGRRLGRCRYHIVINNLRTALPRSHYAARLQDLA